jgi:hypothetical protein
MSARTDSYVENGLLYLQRDLSFFLNMQFSFLTVSLIYMSRPQLHAAHFTHRL